MKNALFAALFFSIVHLSLSAEDPFDKADSGVSERDQKLAEYLTGSKFIGRFTVVGKEDGKMPAEEYTLQKVEKMPVGNMFMITARIKYGQKDVTVPMPIPIEWAAKTPMISLDNFTIPGMGTFSAKIVLNNNRYAGTWTHDDKGGHMFGVIEKPQSAEEEPKSDEAE